MVPSQCASRIPYKPFCRLALHLIHGPLFLTVSLDKVDKDISDMEYALSILTGSHPLFPPLLGSLAHARLARFYLSGDQRDRDMSIINLSHAIFLPFGPFSTDGPNPITAFLHLSKALLERSYKLKQLSGVECSLKYLHFLRD